MAAQVNLRGVIPDKAATAVGDIHTRLQALTSQVQSIAAKPTLTPDQAQKQFGPQVMQQALSANGSNPLNAVGLLTGGFTGSVTISGTTLVFVRGLLQSHNP